MIYFDNAATSWPKPPGLAEAMATFLAEAGASPGRSGHRLALKSGRIVYQAREAVAELFHSPDPLRVAFTHNITSALNQALWGILKKGDHVVTSSIEHNSMMRPLRELERQGVELSVVQCAPSGMLDLQEVEAAIRPDTRLIALNYASNVVGAIQPSCQIGRIARKHDLLLLVDTAQSAGALPIDMEAEQIDLLAFTGHKALYGPTGTGGLILGDRITPEEFTPLLRGGTGSHSELEEQPNFWPDACESGTLNAVGLAGLLHSIQWLQEQGIEKIREHEMLLTRHLLEELCNISGVTVYGPHDATQQTACVAFNIQGLESSEVGMRLDDEYAIMCRIGLHCSPAAHKTIGTFPNGAVRFGLGAFNTPEEVDAALRAVYELAKEAQ